MNKKLILVASPPACGKTYASQLIAKSVEHVVYLDKDDLCDLLSAAFVASGNPIDMDGEFYINNLRSSEYSTILNIAFSALQFEDVVVLNAPFIKEVRDTEYMRTLTEKAHAVGAELHLVWVSLPMNLWYERMKTRNNPRDLQKLTKWEEYARTVDHTPPLQLLKQNAVDGYFIFNNENHVTVEQSLKEILKIILEK